MQKIKIKTNLEQKGKIHWHIFVEKSRPGKLELLLNKKIEKEKSENCFCIRIKKLGKNSNSASFDGRAEGKVGKLLRITSEVDN